jgi:hypothetical protein
VCTAIVTYHIVSSRHRCVINEQFSRRAMLNVVALAECRAERIADDTRTAAERVMRELIAAEKIQYASLLANRDQKPGARLGEQGIGGEEQPTKKKNTAKKKRKHKRSSRKKH